jgi:hypothetical protein
VVGANPRLHVNGAFVIDDSPVLLLVLIVTLIRGTSDTVERTRRDMELGAVVRGLFDTIASDLARKQPMADDDVALAFVPGVEGTRQDALALLVASRGFANEQWAESRLAAAWYGGAMETLESGGRGAGAATHDRAGSLGSEAR